MTGNKWDFCLLKIDRKSEILNFSKSCYLIVYFFGVAGGDFTTVSIREIQE